MGTGQSGARRQPFLGQGICNQHQSTQKKINHQLQSSASWKVVPLRCHCQRYRWWRWPKSIDILEMEDNPPPKWQGKLNRTTAWIWGFTQEKLRDLGIFTTEMHKHMDVNQQLSAFSRVWYSIYPDLPRFTHFYKILLQALTQLQPAIEIAKITCIGIGQKPGCESSILPMCPPMQCTSSLVQRLRHSTAKLRLLGVGDQWETQMFSGKRWIKMVPIMVGQLKQRVSAWFGPGGIRNMLVKS